MSWDHLRFFLALARHGTLTGAARDLAVNHTTVGRRLRSLEQDFGVRLFDRTGPRHVLTDAGQEVLVVAQAMEARLQSLDRKVLGQDRQLTGPLNVTTILTEIREARPESRPSCSS
ncbi:MAG: DNA-binding transcriptional LysR family regulator [Myxococcota bacterium]|jgi:DNA-binding transcriptional LysR family regulator